MMSDSELYYIHSGEKDTGPTMVLTDYWDDSLRSTMLERGIQYLTLSRSANWEDQDVNFLKSLDFLKGVGIYAYDIKDVSVLRHLPALEHIGLGCELSVELDVSHFSQLRTFYAKHNKKLINWWEVPTLERLNIENYPFEDLVPLRPLASLERLQLTSSKLKTLKGINSLKDLKILDLYRCTKLVSLESLSEVKELEEIEIETCKRIESLDEFGSLGNLKKVTLNNCGTLLSVAPLKKCLKLSGIVINGDTSIVDGNISKLLELPALKKYFFVDKKHYDAKQKEVEKILREKML